MPHYFPRGDGPLVSVLLPTRGRPEWMRESILSLWDHAFDRRLLEFHLKVDLDDAPTLRMVEQMRADGIPLMGIGSPRARGYADMHLWVNELCTYAKGDWIYLWNDDARMPLRGWDQMLLSAAVSDISTWHGCTDVCLFTTPTKGRWGSPEFNLVRRKAVEVMGFYSMNPHNDSWLYAVMSFIGCAFTIPQLEVEHLSLDNQDEVRMDVLEAYKQAGKDLNSDDGLRVKWEACGRLIEYIKANRRK